MNDKLKQILSNMKKYNAGIMFQEVFGFDPEEVNFSAVYANKYHYTRSVIIPQIIFALAGEK